jgi:hypothetical protein
MTEPYEPYGAEWQARPPREKANQIITDLNERIERALIEALGTPDLLGIGDGAWRASALCFELKNFISRIEDGHGLSLGPPRKDDQ